jgi:hypothetical protein
MPCLSRLGVVVMNAVVPGGEQASGPACARAKVDEGELYPRAAPGDPSERVRTAKGRVGPGDEVVSGAAQGRPCGRAEGGVGGWLDAARGDRWGRPHGFGHGLRRGSGRRIAERQRGGTARLAFGRTGLCGWSGLRGRARLRRWSRVRRWARVRRLARVRRRSGVCGRSGGFVRRSGVCGRPRVRLRRSRGLVGWPGVWRRRGVRARSGRLAG